MNEPPLCVWGSVLGERFFCIGVFSNCILSYYAFCLEIGRRCMDESCEFQRAL
mgnify:CR=1 FL=1